MNSSEPTSLEAEGQRRCPYCETVFEVQVVQPTCADVPAKGHDYGMVCSCCVHVFVSDSAGSNRRIKSLEELSEMVLMFARIGVAAVLGKCGHLIVPHVEAQLAEPSNPADLN